jgi:hypothetical protein
LKTIGSSLVPILQDIDPENGIEDEYKKKKHQVYCWRFLRTLSFVDLVNFHGKPENQKQFYKFEGNIEEQALILYNKHKRKEIDLAMNGNADVRMMDAGADEAGAEHRNGGNSNANE